MLSFFRRGGGIAQVIMGAVVVTIIVVFVVEFRQGGRAQGKVNLECAVKVMSYCADLKEFQASEALVVPPGADPKWIRQQRIDRYVLEGLEERELLHAEAVRLGIEVSEQELDNELEKGRMHVSLPVADARTLSGRLGLCRVADARDPACIPGAEPGIRLLRVKNSKTDEFDYKVYERTIRVTTNRGAREFKEMQHRELVAERVRQLVRVPVRVSEQVAWEVFQRENTKAVALMVPVRRVWFARYAVDLSDKAVDEWAKGNESEVNQAWDQQKDGWKADCPLVSELLVSLPEEASDQEKEARKSRLTEVAKALEAGADFAMVARQTSELDSALAGGGPSCFDPKHYGDEDGKKLAAVLEGLKQGSVTPAIETTRGYYLLKYHGKLEESARERTAKRQIARDLAVRFKADGLTKQFADQLLAKVKAGGKLDEATKELVASTLAQANGAAKAGKKAAAGALPSGADLPSAPKAEETRPFTVVSSPVPNTAPGVQVAPQLFALEPGSPLPTPVETMEGFAVLVLKDKTAAKRADFDQKKADLIGRLRDLKADDALVSYVRRLRTAAGERIKIDKRLLEENEKKNAPTEE
jgi:parvulin-like peptidyl-prolyl isomerase